MYKLEATIFHHSLCLGIVKAKQISAWADSIISNCDEAEDWMIELALCGSKSVNHTIEALRLVPGEVANEELWPQLKKVISEAVLARTLNHRDSISYLYNLALDGVVPDYDRESIYQFELDYDCAQEGYGSISSVNLSVQHYLYCK